MTVRFASDARIGIFGGTFDPIHYGHLRAAEEAREAFALSRILFIPSAQPPHKTDQLVTSADHRIEMARRATHGHPVFEVSDLECARPGASYSVETLRILREQEGREAELFFLLGLDAFLEINTWRCYDQLFHLSHWVVIQRPGCGSMGRRALPAAMDGRFRYDRLRGAYMHTAGSGVFFRRFRSLEISGTEIRGIVRSGRSIRYLVPEEVRAYIEAHGLYASGATPPIAGGGHAQQGVRREIR